MKSRGNKGKLPQKSDNDTKIEDVLPFPTFPFMTFSVNHDTFYVKILVNLIKHYGRGCQCVHKKPVNNS